MRNHGGTRCRCGIVLVGIALVLSTFRDYGVTWDEDVHNWYGNFVLDYYLSLFGDKTALHWRDLYNYGAVFDMVAAALNRVSPIGVYETRHLLNGLVGILGLIGCWKLGRVVAGPRAGFIASLLLISTPNYYGQMFNNPKDIPFAVGIVWSTYYLIRIVPTLPRPPFGDAGQTRCGDRYDDGCEDRRPVADVLFEPPAGAGRDLARRCRQPVRRVGRHRLGQFLASSPPGRRRCLSGHVVVLAVGADRPDRESVARPCLFLASDFPVLHVVRRPVCAGERPAMDLSPDLYRPRAAGARSRPVIFCSGCSRGRALAR